MGKYISCAEDVLAKHSPGRNPFSVVQDDFASIGKAEKKLVNISRKEKLRYR